MLVGASAGIFLWRYVMKKWLLPLTFAWLTIAAAAGGDLVKFPENFKDGVMYLEKDRGNLTEYIYTDKEAINAAKEGRDFPYGTVITLVEYYRETGRLKRYVVMEKQKGWGESYPEDIRNGEWEYQAFNPDGSVQTDENLNRCFSCHKSVAEDDYVFTVDAMKSY